MSDRWTLVGVMTGGSPPYEWIAFTWWDVKDGHPQQTLYLDSPGDADLFDGDSREAVRAVDALMPVLRRLAKKAKP